MTDVWPCLWGKDNEPNDFVVANFWDVGAAAFQNTQVLADALKAQWVPQRSGFGFRSNGKWGFGIIVAITNNLEYWENADVGFTADGIWALTDSESSEDWLAVDLESRQNYAWAHVARAAPIAAHLYIDLKSGVPTWAGISTAMNIDSGDGHYSITLDSQLRGGLHTVYHPAAGSVDYAYAGFNGGQAVIQNPADFPQVVTDGHDRIFAFYTDINTLYCEDSSNVYAPIFLKESQFVYIATALTQDYMVAHNPVDDTIHVVLVDHDPAGNSLLIYLRRTPDSWSAPVTLKTVDTGGVGITLSWPQITLDWFNNICIKFIYNDGVGDLRQFLLTTDDYSEFDTPGNWTESSNVDDSEDDVLWVVAPTNMPEWIPTSGVADEFILLEGGDFILLEGGDKIIL